MSPKLQIYSASVMVLYITVLPKLERYIQATQFYDKNNKCET